MSMARAPSAPSKRLRILSSLAVALCRVRPLRAGIYLPPPSKNLHSALKVGKLGQLILPNKLALEAACAVADPYRSWSR